MDKLKVIQRAKSYMDMLAKGIDPISKELITDDSVLLQERLQSCFSFISDILREVIENDGLVPLPENQSSGYVLVKKKAAFSLDFQQKINVRITNELISPAAFVKSLNAVVDGEAMEKLSLKTVNQWLLDKGYINETKAPTVVNRTVKTSTALSESIGIFEQVVVDKNTGETKKELRFSRQAQQFILDNLDEIAGYKK